MKIARVNGEVKVNREGEIVRSIIAMRFMWMPGMRPVMVPARTPRERAIIISIIILLCWIPGTFQTFGYIGHEFLANSFLYLI